MSRKLLPQVTQHFLDKGVDVYTYFVNKDKTPLPLPLGELSFFTKNFYKLKHPHPKLAGAVMLTAGSRGWHYGGLRVLDNHGEFLDNEIIQKLQTAVDDAPAHMPRNEAMPLGKERNLLGEAGHYNKFLQGLIDFRKINALRMEVYFDSMHGASQDTFKKAIYPWIKEIFHTHGEFDSTYPRSSIDGRFKSKKALQHFFTDMEESQATNFVGIRNNADASALQLIDENKKVVSANDMACLMIEHLVKNKKKHGVVIKTQDISSKVNELCRNYSLPVIEVPKGIKNVLRAIKLFNKQKENVLLAITGQGELATIGGPLVPDALFNNCRILEMLGQAQDSIYYLNNKIDKSLRYYYSQKKWPYKVNHPEQFIKNVIAYSKTKKSVGICKINPCRTSFEFKEQKKFFPVEKEIKLYFEDGGWLLISPPKEKGKDFEITLEVRTKKSLMPWLGKRYHLNREDAIYYKTRDLLGEMDRQN